MHLSKPFNVRYSVSLHSKSITEVESRDFHVIFKNVLPVMPLKKMLKYTKLQKDIPHSKRHRIKLHKGFLIAPKTTSFNSPLDPRHCLLRSSNSRVTQRMRERLDSSWVSGGCHSWVSSGLRCSSRWFRDRL
jgi:hypothetical protein